MAIILNTDIKELRLQYALKISQYKKLGHNLKEALGSFLTEDNIPFVSVEYRLKTYNSFIEKMQKKRYQNPFNETEDLCGLRIICYFQSDVERIKKILKKEFEIVESFDKEKRLNPTEFGYRSSHFVVRIKKEWLHAPNYRGLEDLKAEIQIRTILMHSWAEIEHKLAYKRQEHIPPQFRRKFSRISAKLEEADEQFEELINSIGEHKEELVSTAKKEMHFDKGAEMNLDSLQAFLDYHFPGGKKDIGETRDMVDEFLRLKISIRDLVDSYEKVKDYIPGIEKQIKGIQSEIEQANLLKSVMSKSEEKKPTKSKIRLKRITPQKQL